jgi:hypothetical protein
MTSNFKTRWVRLICAMALLLPFTGRAASEVVVFGLTNSALGTAELLFQGSDLLVSSYAPDFDRFVAASSTPPPTLPTTIDFFEYYGVSVQLGEADSGVFFYPYSSYMYDAASMVGKTYGSVNGQPDELIATMRAVRHTYGVYSIATDFTPIGSSKVTFEVFDNHKLVATSSNQTSALTIYTESEYAPRANPFFRAADGSVGAVVELSGARQISVPGTDGVYGDRILIRAEGVTAEVEFASRLDVMAGGGLSQFVVTDERLGVFHRGHKALGNSLLQARAGQLTLSTNAAESGSPGANELGVLIEVDQQRHFSVEVAPIELPADSALVASAVVGLNGAGTEFLGYAGVRNVGGALQAFGNCAALDGGLLLSVFRDDCEIGAVHSLTITPDIGLGGNPRVAGLDAMAETGHGRPGFALRLDRLTLFTFPDGTVLEGNQLRFRAANAQRFARLTTFSLTSSNLGSLTIVGESSGQGIHLADYLPEFAVPASIKQFSGLNDGITEDFSQSAATATRDGRSFIELTDLISPSLSRSQLLRFAGDDLFFHGASAGGFDLFSRSGLRLLPAQLVVGQTYNGVGDFQGTNSGSGLAASVMVSSATHVAALERIIVPAGDFQAVRLETTMTFSNATESGGPVARTTTWWLGPEVGILKLTESETLAGGAMQTRSAEMTAYNLITSPPQRPTANVGSDILLLFHGNEDSSATSIQWTKNEMDLPDATTGTLPLNNVQFSDAGVYSIVVSNLAGVVSSVVATVEVISFSDAPSLQAVGETTVGTIGSEQIVTDHLGNIYLAGTFAGSITFGTHVLTSPTPADPVFIVKYDPAGNVLWAKEGGGQNIQSLDSVQVDGTGNIYLLGTSRGSVTFGSFTVGGGPSLGLFMVKMSPAGDYLWAAAPQSTGFQLGHSMVVDTTGAVYVAGEFGGSMTLADTELINSTYPQSAFIFKMNSGGDFVWARQAEPGDLSAAYSLAIAPDGGLRVGGHFRQRVQFGSLVLNTPTQSGFVLAMDAGGASLNLRRIGSAVQSLGFDGAGSLYVKGWLNAGASLGEIPLIGGHGGYSTDQFVTRLLPNGSLAWATLIEPFDGSSRTMEVDSFGNAYLASTFYGYATAGGTMFSSPGDYSTLVSKLNSDGRQVWSKQVVGGYYNSPSALATDSTGNLFLAGLFRQSLRLGDATFSGPNRANPFWVKFGAVAAPEIVQAPQPQTVNAGEGVTFSVTVTGLGPFAYQWQHNGVDIPGANSSSLSLAEAKWEDAGPYVVVVRNGGGITVSPSALLQVITPDAGAFNFSMANYAAGESGGSASIEVVRSGGVASSATVTVMTGDLSARAGIDYVGTVATLSFAPGETSKAFTVPLIQDGIYELPETLALRLCPPGGGASLGAPNTATITITDDDPPAPVILTQPHDRAIAEGRNATLSVIANGEAPLLYQWSKDGVELPNGTGSTYLIVGADTGDAGSYSVVVRNAAGQITSDTATVTIRFLPVIVLPPQNTTVPYGDSVTLSVVATNSVAIVTNHFDGSGMGSAEVRIPVPLTGQRSILRLDYHFETESDTLRIFDGEVLLYDAGGAISGDGYALFGLAASLPRLLTVVINADGSGGSDGWSIEGELVPVPLDFRWFKNNIPIPGANGSTYTIPSARPYDVGEYTVMVSDNVGEVVSMPALLTITPPILQLRTLPAFPEMIQLWWTSPDHYPEFITDLNDAAVPGNWTVVPNWEHGMLLPKAGEPRFFRLRIIGAD